MRGVGLLLSPLDQFTQADLLLWFQMTLLLGGLVWCLALASILFFGGWYACTHPDRGPDRTLRRLVGLLDLLTLGLTESQPPVVEGEKPQGEGSMDKQEAERLVAAIKRLHVAWLQVDQIAFNEVSQAYELECSYRGPAGFLGSKAVWRTRRISSPREWIDLLTTHRNTL